MNEQSSFLKNHMDTIAIVGVNVAIAAILVCLWISNSSRIDATNARIDNTYNMFYELLKEVKG